MEATPQFFNDSASAGYNKNTPQGFVDAAKANAPVAHIEDGAWIFPEMDYGSPNFMKWIEPPLYNTAINAETGTVVKHSLRGTELTIPVSLFANLSFKPTALDADTFAQQQLVLDKNVSKDLIEPALSLVDLCGAHRSRGLGEVIVSLKNA